MHVLPCPHLQDPVIGSESSSVGWSIGSDHVDINTFLQETIRHAETKVINLWILYHCYLRGIKQRQKLADLNKSNPS